MPLFHAVVAELEVLVVEVHEIIGEARRSESADVLLVGGSEGQRHSIFCRTAPIADDVRCDAVDVTLVLLGEAAARFPETTGAGK